MFLDVLEFRMKTNKKCFGENCFENVVSDLWEKKVYVSTKVILEKSSKTKNNYKLKIIKTFIIFVGQSGQN